ncbi:hypothetical protein HRbin12_01525 [bacterium HR12]|nr:hypothetical protein HRbin12_01525 [bacterium HR12]
MENHLCGCGAPFSGCSFWTEVGKAAFGGWDEIDPGALRELQRSVDRNRFIPLMLARGWAPTYRRRLVHYGEHLARLYRAIADVSGANVIVDSSKHASYAYLLREVGGIDLRVIHLVRDPRGVAYSWTKEIRKPEVTDRVEFMPRYHPGRMAFRYLAYNGAFHVLRGLGVPTHLVRYEAFVARPQEHLLAILRFAGLEATVRHVDGTTIELRPTHSVAGNPMRFRQGRLDLRIDDAWRTEMDRRLAMIVGMLTWPLRCAYGYRQPGRMGGAARSSSIDDPQGQEPR